MNWNTWTKKLLMNAALAIVAVVIAALASAQEGLKPDDKAAVIVAVSMVVLKAAENLLKHTVMAKE
jgi:predicted outer membrane protein